MKFKGTVYWEYALPMWAKENRAKSNKWNGQKQKNAV